MKALKSAIASFIATVVLSASGIALAADGDAVETPNTTSTVVATDTRAGDGADGNEGNSDPASDPQPSDTPTSTPTSEPTWDECSNLEGADGALVQRCTGEDGDGNLVAKSSVELPEDKNSPSASKPATSASRVQPQSSPAAPSRNAQSLSLPVANGVADAVVATDNPEVEKPKLPITGANKSVTVSGADKGTKGGSQNAAGAALDTENPLIAASSRASLFTMVACALFVVVGAGSVVSVRRLKH